VGYELKTYIMRTIFYRQNFTLVMLSDEFVGIVPISFQCFIDIIGAYCLWPPRLSESHATTRII